MKHFSEGAGRVVQGDCYRLPALQHESAAVTADLVEAIQATEVARQRIDVEALSVDEGVCRRPGGVRADRPHDRADTAGDRCRDRTSSPFAADRRDPGEQAPRPAADVVQVEALPDGRARVRWADGRADRVIKRRFLHAAVSTVALIGLYAAVMTPFITSGPLKPYALTVLSMIRLRRRQDRAAAAQIPSL